MPLSPATRLGPYQIIAPVGAGGMGEVYRARDTRLDRTVAIKILPEHISSKPQAPERFEREARAVSSLNHPHICTLHDIGYQDGISFLVMEFLEGETLAHQLTKGPLPPAQVLEYAIQIADALGTAHRHGVIHRDLKPGNIMLTKSGTKLLDFGLAKMATGEMVAGVTAFATETTPLTGDGAVLGTLQYMAPEQLEGKEADARTDLFAFGAVLYEMATGRKAFEGKTQAMVIAAILKDDPAPISTLQPLTPPQLDHVVRTCLAKEPEDRWQSAHDLLLELKWIGEAGSQAGIPAPLAWRRRRRQLVSWSLAAVASLAFLALAAIHFREKPAETQLIRFQVPPPEKVIVGWVDIPVVSPNGRYVVFSETEPRGEPRLWLHSLDSLTTEPLPRTEGAYFPFWSPDSRFVAFFTQDNKLKKIDISSGPPEVLCDAAWPAAGGAWNQGGVILFVPESGKTQRISAAGGDVKPALELNKSRKETAQRWPHFLPDGRHFLYLSRSGEAGKSGIYAASLDSNETQRVISAESNVSYAEPGFLIFGRQETLMAQPFDIRKLRTTGDAFAVADHVWSMPLQGAVFSVSQNGVLAYRTASSINTQLAWYGRDGKRLETVGPPGSYGQLALSLDEKRLVVERFDPAKKATNLWVLELSSSIFSRLTFSEDFGDTDPVWSPNGREVVFRSNRGGRLGLYRKVVGGGEETLLLEPGEEEYPQNWPGNGASIIVINQGGKAFSQLPLSGQRKPTVLLKSEFDKDEPSVSPDGRWIAYNSTESGQWEVYVAAFPGFTEKRQVSNNGGGQSLWRKDGKELFYLALDGKLMVVDVKAGATIETGMPKVLFQTPLAVNPQEDQFCVSGDGRRFLFAESVGETAKPITMVLNWAAGLKR